MSLIKLAEPDAAYRKEVVEKLEKLLAAAKRGQILSIMYACDRPGGAVTTGSTTMKDRYVMLGYLSSWMHHIHLSLDDTATPSDILTDDT